MNLLYVFLTLIGFANTITASGLVEYYVALYPQNVGYLQQRLLDISNPLSSSWRKFMTKDEILKYSSPIYEEKLFVIEWLKTGNTECNDLGDALFCVSTEETANTLWVINENNYMIPEKFGDIIAFVEGLIPIKSKIRKPTITTTRKVKNIPQPDTHYIGLEVMNRLYNLTTSNASGVSLAAIEYQGNSGFNQADINLNNKLNNVLPDNVSHVIGSDTYPDTETQLDLQMEALLAPNSDLWFWDDNNWLLSFSLNFSNSANIPDVISMSWGWAEDSQCSIISCGNKTSEDYVNRVNFEYVKIGLRGVSIMVASGDAGAPGRTSEVCLSNRPVNPVMPGSSPWVTSVSATFVVESTNKVNWTTKFCQDNGCASGSTQLPTNFEQTDWTTGGGFAIYSSEGRTTWQSQAVDTYLSSNVSLPTNFSRYGRGYPDVSTIGHYCPVYTKGILEGVDGTSCASPVFAGMVALMNAHERSKGRPNLGFLNPLLYYISDEYQNTFNDITEGNNYCTEQNCCPTLKDGGSNYGYLATKGWDPVSGLGTPNLGNILSALDSLNSY